MGVKMSKRLQLEGRCFGRLKVIKEHGVNKDGKTVWECECECGNRTFSIGSNLKSGKSQSCGCLKNEVVSKRMIKHGMAGKRIYRTWQNMKRRCYDEKSKDYKNYGARGISICQEWIDNFQTFYDWAMDNGYCDNLTIERKDVNSNYCPENCCWIPLSEQTKNKTITKRVSGGEFALDVAANNCVKPSTMYSRIRRGMNADDSVTNKNFKKKSIQQIDIETGDIIAVFKSVREAGRSINKSCSDISLCANGKLNKAYGYAWKFVSE